MGGVEVVDITSDDQDPDLTSPQRADGSVKEDSEPRPGSAADRTGAVLAEPRWESRISTFRGLAEHLEEFRQEHPDLPGIARRLSS